MNNQPVSHRYMTLTVTIALLMILSPLLKRSPATAGAALLLFLVMSVAALWSVTRSRMAFYTGLLVVVIAFTSSVPRYLRLDWGPVAWPLHVVGLVFYALFCGLVIWGILRQMWLDFAVTLDTLFGGICVYLLLGLMWEFLYHLTVYLFPGSLLQNGQPLTAGPETFDLLLYFSFMTMTTVGYGDVVPAGDVARFLAVVQSVVGQLYLIILIGGLVAIRTSAPRPPQPAPDPKSPLKISDQ